MKLILPNGKKVELDNDLELDQRKEVVDEILNEWDDYFTKYKNNRTHVCLEVLSNYLCYERKKVGEDNA